MEINALLCDHAQVAGGVPGTGSWVHQRRNINVFNFPQAQPDPVGS